MKNKTPSVMSGYVEPAERQKLSDVYDPQKQ